ncbi:hypothetical protein EV174_001758, partial [Coemansia sp. RSA 2320]
ENEESAAQKYKAVAGAQTEPLYGIRLAERMGLPADVIRVARAVAAEVNTPTTPTNSK